MRSRIALSILLSLVVSAAAFGSRFGTGCQGDFENTWLTEVRDTWERCERFNNKLAQTDEHVFYWDLHDGASWWQNARDQIALDNVDLFYGCTHGGVNSTSAAWAMWNYKTNAWSTLMRLGDEAVGLSFLATYSCDTLKYDDGRVWTRMAPILRGGARMVLGSYGKFWDSWYTTECGEVFANGLQNGWNVKDAWIDGNTDWYFQQEIAFMATGRDQENCDARRDSMTWSNFNDYPRLRDNQIGHACLSAWVGFTAPEPAGADFGVPEVALLRAKPGPGVDAALKAVKARLANMPEQIHFGGASKTEAGTEAAIERGPGWILEVQAGGNKVHYKNFGYLDGPKNALIPIERRLKQEELEAKGRRFIADELRDLIHLEPGEELVPHFTQYEYVGSAPATADAKLLPQNVRAAVVVFSRTIGGQRVLGGGSKIAITFATDGTVAGFQYDWPQYQRLSKTQKVLPIAAIRQRAHKLAPEEMDRPGVKVERVECGYSDRGSGRRNEAAPLQPACVFFTVSRPALDQTTHLTIAKAAVIPAGETVEPDATWPHAQKLLGKELKGAKPPKHGPTPPVR